MPTFVRYKVVKKTFVNGSLIDPAMAAGPMYIEAAPGLESEALQLAPDAGRTPSPLGGDTGLKLGLGTTPQPPDLSAQEQQLTAELADARAQLDATGVQHAALVSANHAMSAERDVLATRAAQLTTENAALLDAVRAAEDRAATADEQRVAAEARATQAEADLAAATAPKPAKGR